MSQPRPYLVLATPGMGYMVDYHYMQSLFRLIFTCNSRGLPVALEMISHDPIIARARDTLAAKFLDRPQATHILFIGPDTRFSVRQVFGLMALNLDVVAAPVPAAAPTLYTPLDSAPPPGTEAAELAGDDLNTLVPPGPGPAREVACASLDFMLIRRTVFTRLHQAYPDLRYAGALDDSSGYKSPNLYALFDSEIDSASRTYLSGDEVFCRRWRAIGGKIFYTANTPATR